MQLQNYVCTSLGILLLTWTPAASAQGSSAHIHALSFRDSVGQYTITFDPNKMAEYRIKNLILLSPLLAGDTSAPRPKGMMLTGSVEGKKTDKAIFVLPLEACPDSDPEYKNCEGNGIRSPDFFRNAEVNLRRGREVLSWLDQLSYPNELRPVVQYLRRRLAISVWMEESKLKYYKSWDQNILEQNYAALHPSQLCAEALQKLSGAASIEERYQIARLDWTNCLIQAATERYGGRYPMGSWKSFLAAYELSERYKDESPD